MQRAANLAGRTFAIGFVGLRTRDLRRYRYIALQQFAITLDPLEIDVGQFAARDLSRRHPAGLLLRRGKGDVFGIIRDSRDFLRRQHDGIRLCGIADARDTRIESQGRREGVRHVQAAHRLEVFYLFREKAVLGFFDRSAENQAALFFRELEAEQLLRLGERSLRYAIVETGPDVTFCSILSRGTGGEGSSAATQQRGVKNSPAIQ